MKKRIFFSAGVIFLAGLIWGVFYINTLIPIITGYSAKYLCSAVFISNRIPAEVAASELNFSFIRYVTNDVNYQDRSVTSHFLWGQSKAIFREGFGSTLLRGVDETALRKVKFPSQTDAGYDQDTIPWPLGNLLPDRKPGHESSSLDKITDDVMIRNKYHGVAFAFIVVHNGIPVVEKYRNGFNSATRFQSWSMAKSFTNALAGMMVMDGKLDIHQKTGIRAWKNDSRQLITINELMQMQSGLRWNEDYGNRSDVTLMLYNNKDFAGFAINQPADFTTGSHWYYSSGSANIVSYMIRKRFTNDEAYYAYAKTRLFNKTGMPHAIFETDPSGTLVGSSYIFATARDYARFGLLYLQDGVFNGERILPEGWVSYTSRAASHSDGSYGSLFWLNRGNYYPSAPADMLICNGHDGQRIFIIPSEKMVVVILGYSPMSGGGMNFNQLLCDILTAIR